MKDDDSDDSDGPRVVPGAKMKDAKVRGMRDVTFSFNAEIEAAIIEAKRQLAEWEQMVGEDQAAQVRRLERRRWIVMGTFILTTIAAITVLLIVEAI